MVGSKMERNLEQVRIDRVVEELLEYIPGNEGVWGGMGKGGDHGYRASM